jgi:2'-5' RNA ligase
LSTTNQLLFIALLPPQEIQDFVTEIKQIFATRYQSSAALKSPPHITLHPPFSCLPEDRQRLTQALQQFAIAQSPIPITLSGFGAFAPRVIFINVLKTPELLALHQAWMVEAEQIDSISDPTVSNYPFSPHITVGFRDLTQPNFNVAWAEFQHRPVQLEFLASHLTLLIHNGQRWIIDQTLPFALSYRDF